MSIDDARRTWPLRRLAALWALLLGLGLVAAFLLNALQEAEATAWRRAVATATSEAARISVVAERLVDSDPSVVTEVMVHAVLQDAVATALVADPRHQIVASTHAADLGRSLQDAHPVKHRILVERGVGEGLQFVEDRDAGLLRVMRTLQWPAPAGAPRSAARGTLWLQLDVGEAARRLQAQAMRAHIAEAAVLLLGAALLFLGLDRLVLQPVARLRTAAQRLGSGLPAGETPQTLMPRSKVRELDALGQSLARSTQDLQATLQRLQDSEQRFRALAASAPDAIITLDGRGLVDQFNQAAERLFGYSAEEMRGRSLEPLLPEGSAGRHAGLVQGFEHEPESAGSARRMEAGRLVSGRHRDGRTLHLEVGISRSRVGGEMQFTAVVRDVSDRVAIEGELETYRRSLEDLVRRRTLELVHERDRAQSATRAKNEFLARIGHELRTPMNTVLGMAHLLRQQSAGVQATRLAALDAAARQLHALLEDILDFTRIEAGQFSLAPTANELRPLLHAVVQGLAPTRRKPEVELVLWIDADVPERLVLDGLRLRQVLGHLLDNAMKFTAEGHVTVRVSATQLGPASADLRFEVSDSGIGIPAAQLDRLFEPFEQVDGSDSRAYGGAGIGLVICQRVLALMGCELRAQSQLGRGTRFGFTLRCPLAPLGQDDRAQPPALPLSGRALVLEALPDARAAQAEALRSLGLVVDTADDGVSAMRMLRAAVQRGEPVDWVLVGAAQASPVLSLPADALAQGLAPAPRWLLALPDSAMPPLMDALRSGYVGMVDKPVMAELLRERLRGGAGRGTDAPPAATPGTGSVAVSAAAAAAARPGDLPAEPDAARPAHDPAHGLALQSVAGLDLDRGLRSVRGDRDAYVRLLHSFVQFHGADPELLRRAAQQGDVAALKARAHSLKSAAGSVGAVGLQALAQRLAAVDPAAAGGSGRESWPPGVASAALELAHGLDALVTELQAALDQLAAHSAGPGTGEAAGLVGSSTAPAAFDARQARAQRQSLRQSLSQRNMEALRWLQTVSDDDLVRLGLPAHTLRRAVAAFDFDTALRVLDEAEAAMPSETP